MEIKDLLITPVWLILIYAGAYVLRKKVTDPVILKYYFPALTVRLLGAIGVGLIYQYYYNGGDTFNFFTHGSYYVWEAFKESPLKAMKLIFAQGTTHYPDTFAYSSQIWYYRDLPSYFVVRIVAFFDLFTFHTYSATACLFAALSFSGLWAMFKAFYQLYPKLHKQLAVCILFIPSVFFWGSGIMKDTLTLTAVGWSVYAVIQIFYFKRFSPRLVLLILLSFYIIYSIRVYILLCLIPSLFIWVFLLNLKNIRSTFIRVVAAPFSIAVAIAFSYLAIDQVSKDNNRYAIDKLTRTAEITAKWISYVSDVEGGSGYQLGDFDYSVGGMVKKFPLAINVTLFRPYVWEVQNPVMLLAALESLCIFIFTLYVLLTVRSNFLPIVFSHPEIMFLLLFSITFAFAVGFSTYNFGSLVRYKIPLMPLYVSALSIISYLNKAKKFKKLAFTE